MRARVVLSGFLVVAFLPHASAAAAPDQAHGLTIVTIVGIVCARSREQAGQVAVPRPPMLPVAVRVDGHPVPTLGARSYPTLLEASVKIAPGFHSFLMSFGSDGHSGAGNTIADVLEGAPRHIFVNLCNAIGTYDSWRTVSLELPFSDLAVAVTVHTSQGDISVPVEQEGTFAYAAGLPGGPIDVSVTYGADLMTCVYKLDYGVAGPSQTDEHLRLRLPASELSLAQVPGLGNECGSLAGAMRP